MGAQLIVQLGAALAVLLADAGQGSVSGSGQARMV